MLKNCIRYVLAANLKSFGVFLTEGWVLKMVFKMWRQTSTLLNFVDNSTWNTVRAPEGLAASGARYQGVLGWCGRAWQLQPVSPQARGREARDTGATPDPGLGTSLGARTCGQGQTTSGWHMLTNLTLGKKQTKQLTLTIIHKSIHRMYV